MLLKKHFDVQQNKLISLRKITSLSMSQLYNQIRIYTKISGKKKIGMGPKSENLPRSIYITNHTSKTFLKNKRWIRIRKSGQIASCHPLNSVPHKRYVEVLTPSTPECDHIRKQGGCRYNLLRWGTSVGWAPNTMWLVSS